MRVLCPPKDPSANRSASRSRMTPAKTHHQFPLHRTPRNALFVSGSLVPSNDRVSSCLILLHDWWPLVLPMKGSCFRPGPPSFPLRFGRLFVHWWSDVAAALFDDTHAMMEGALLSPSCVFLCTYVFISLQQVAKFCSYDEHSAIICTTKDTWEF